jgi:recombination DNA repair RAD52 pathway protein
MTDIDRTIKEAKEAMLPYDSWKRLTGEGSNAFAAFCAFRDCGYDRTIHKAVESLEKDETKWTRRYNVFRNWSAQFRWSERAASYDRHIENLKQTELRKTIEAQGEKHREATGKMLDVAIKKLDTMNPEELTQGNVKEWVETAIKAERIAAGLVTADGKPEAKQGELNFVSDFQGL